MHLKTIFISTASASLLLATSAFAVTTDRDNVVRQHAHRHHVARNHNSSTVSDVPQESAAPEIKPQKDPEYFGHASGSDGSMSQD